MKEAIVIDIQNGCVNKPGCNSQQVYVMPFGTSTLQAA